MFRGSINVCVCSPGNEKLHMLTGLRQYELRVDLTDYLGKQYYAKYDSFVVDNEENKYTLHVGEYEGNAGEFNM